jgi:hypothetical protein
MSPNPPIVPSRNALRALRRLAYGGSTIIGAVGSVFTVAGVNYDTRRRVRLAERLIETKRTIKSISNSNGAAHVARMFDAAEKGEDFGLGITISRKENIGRDCSSLATERVQQRSLTETGLNKPRHPPGKGPKRNEGLPDEVSFPPKESVRPLEGSKPSRSRSLSSMQSAKGLFPDPILGQRRSFQQRNREIATHCNSSELFHQIQPVTEPQHTSAAGAGTVPFQRYHTMREVLKLAVRSRYRSNTDLLRTFDLDRGLNHTLEELSALERILASTQQQHKLHDHGVYGRPGKDTVAKLARTYKSRNDKNNARTNSSAAEKIVAATQQQHKLHSHVVYSRPSKANHEVHARLNEHVALWLNGADGSRNDSVLDCRSGSPAKFPRGGGVNSKRPGSTSPKGSSYLKPLQSKLSTSALEAAAVSRLLLTGSQSFQRKDGEVALKPANDPHLATHTSNQGTKGASQVSTNSFSRASDGQLIPSALEKRTTLLSNQRHSSTGSQGLQQIRRVARGSRRYSLRSVSSSNGQGTAAEADKALHSDTEDASSGTPSTPSIALDPGLNLWPASGSTFANFPQTSFLDSSSPRNLQYHATQMDQTEPVVSNDISQEPSLHFDGKSGLQSYPSQKKSEAFFGFEKAFEEAARAYKTDGYAAWYDSIHETIKVHGTPAARQFWLNAMTYYATPGNMLDWKIVDTLHKHFHKKFWTAKPPYFDFYPARLLTRHILETTPTSQRAAKLLFPLHGKEMELLADYAAKGMAYPAKQRSRNMFANASKYLQDFWDEGHDSEKVVSELRKIIRLTKMQNIDLGEDLFFGTIRRLSSHGQIEWAQALFDEMVYYHGIEPSFLTRSVLVVGHGRAGDWDRVAKEIETMHNIHDLSRREPLGYSLMFNDVLVEYASRRSIAQTHDFLVHALGYWGLVPTSAISATAIQAFLSHRRYDLVREWIETVRVLFPQVDTETSRFAWHLGSVFEDINASCVEVEETCKALCYRKDASKVQASLREMVRLALARDLAAKLHAAEVAEARSQKEDNFPAGSPWALAHFLERAESFASGSLAEGGSQSTQSQEARELLSQAESVARLDKLFGTKGKYTTGPSSATVNEQSPSRSFENGTHPAYIASLQSTLPRELTSDILPTLSEVQRLLNKYYSARYNAGLPTSHAILKYTCQKLRKQDRRIDAMQLLKATFDGPDVQSPTGVMFDLSIMEMWLRFAYEAKSLSHCLTVFWAVLDAGEDYLLTSKFVLLANMSCHKVRKNRFDSLATTNPSKHEELGYLLERLRRRLWANKEVSETKRDKTKGAEYRRMKHEMRQRLVLRPKKTVEPAG